MDRQERDKLICNMYTGGKTLREIVQTVGVSQSTIYKVLDRNNVPRKRDLNIQRKVLRINEICKIFDENKEILSPPELIKNIVVKTNTSPKMVLQVLNTYRKEEVGKNTTRKEPVRKTKRVQRQPEKRQMNPSKSKKQNQEKMISFKELEDSIYAQMGEDYVNGMDAKDIVKKYGITHEQYFYTFEATNLEDDSEERLPLNIYT